MILNFIIYFKSLLIISNLTNAIIPINIIPIIIIIIGLTPVNGNSPFSVVSSGFPLFPALTSGLFPYTLLYYFESFQVS